jgi:hypothetical protein
MLQGICRLCKGVIAHVLYSSRLMFNEAILVDCPYTFQALAVTRSLPLVAMATDPTPHTTDSNLLNEEGATIPKARVSVATVTQYPDAITTSTECQLQTSMPFMPNSVSPAFDGHAEVSQKALEWFKYDCFYIYYLMFQPSE